jgi:hypothetical protein
MSRPLQRRQETPLSSGRPIAKLGLGPRFVGFSQKLSPLGCAEVHVGAAGDVSLDLNEAGKLSSLQSYEISDAL